MPDLDFSPNWLSAPGSTIAEIASARGVSEIDLSERLGLTLEQTRRILGGNSPITDEIASLLSETVGGTPRFWVDRETRFRTEIDRQTTQGSDEARRAWLDQLPIKEMIRLGWIAKRTTLEDKVSECLRFFDSMSLGEWRKSYSKVLSAVAFRTTAAFDAMPGSVLAWLQFGKSQAAKIDCADWNKDLFRKSLSEIRRLTRSPRPTTFLPRLREICAKCGVAVVIAPTPKGCHASGATCFLSPKKAMILLSFRYRSDDQFWFTVFHEAGHLILHEQSALFVADGNDVTANEEQEANDFATGCLLPGDSRAELSTIAINREGIQLFAVKHRIARGIVVGQLQHMGRLQHGQLNWLKRRYSAEEVSAVSSFVG